MSNQTFYAECAINLGRSVLSRSTQDLHQEHLQALFCHHNG